MDRTTIAAIFADQEALGGQTVTVCGWARTIRDMKTFGFIELNDGSCFRNLQVVFADNEVENFKEIAKCTPMCWRIIRRSPDRTWARPLWSWARWS